MADDLDGLDSPIPDRRVPAQPADASDRLSTDELDALDDIPDDDADPNAPGAWDSALQGAATGATFGLRDELLGLGYGALGSGGDFGSRYREERDYDRARQKRAQEANPLAYGTGEFVGSLPTFAAMPETGLFKGAGLLNSAGRAAIAGGTAGAIQGAGESDGDIGDRLRAGTTGGLAGAAVGAGAGLAFPAIGAVARGTINRLERSLSPDAGVVSDIDQLREQTDNPVRVTNDQVSGNPVVGGLGKVFRKGVGTSDIMQSGAEQGEQDLQDIVQDTADAYGQGNPARPIAEDIEDQAAAEDARAAARRQADLDARTQAANAADEQARADLQTGVGGEGMHPLDTGETTGNGVRDAYEAQHDQISDSYDDVNRNANASISRADGPEQFANNIEDKFAERGDSTNEIQDILGQVRNMKSVDRGASADRPPRAAPGAADQTPPAPADIEGAPSADLGQMSRKDIYNNILKNSNKKTADRWSENHPEIGAFDENPDSLAEFLIREGGLKSHSDFGSDAQIPRFKISGRGGRPSSLINDGERGMTIGEAQRKAEAAGYLQRGGAGFNEAGNLSSQTKFVDKIRSELGGDPQYPIYREGYVPPDKVKTNLERHDAENYANDQRFRRAIDADEEASGLDDEAKARIETSLRADPNFDRDPAASVKRAFQDEVYGDGRPFPGDTSADSVVNARGIFQTLKNLNRQLRNAKGERRYLIGRVIGDLHDEIGDAIQAGRFNGEINYDQLRATNAEFKSLMDDFGYNSKAPDARFVRGIVEGNIDDENVASHLVGLTKLGNFRGAADLLRRIKLVTNNDPEVLGSIVRGIFGHIAGGVEGLEARDPAAAAEDIRRLIGRGGRDFADELLTPDQKALFTAYARRLDQSVNERAGIAASAKEKPEIGPLRQLARDLLGRSGDQADEAIYRNLKGMMQSGGRADIETFGNLIRALPQHLRGQLAGAILRQIGRDPANPGADWSLARAVREWDSYTPRAKDLLFGNAGLHRSNVDLVMRIGKVIIDNERRYANHSGTALHGALMGTFYALLHHPVSTLGTIFISRQFAKLLASPVTSHRMATLLRSAAEVDRNATPEALSSYRRAVFGMSRAARQIGASIQPALINRATAAITAQQRPASDQDQRN